MACPTSFSNRKHTFLVMLTIVSLTVGRDAGADSPLEYCGTLVDYLASRPCMSPATVIDSVEVATRIRTVEDRVLQWGREEELPGLAGEMPEDQRGAALHSVYEGIANKYMKTVVLPHNAPDAGVQVSVGEPRVVMFAPEGDINDRVASIARIGYERWAHYMGPSIHRLRDGKLLARVYVGGEGYNPATSLGRFRFAGSPEYLNYVSQDGGRHWLHFASYDRMEANERPAGDIATRLADGEEIRYRRRVIEFDLDDPRIRPHFADYYRLGDLPPDEQWIPIFSRRPGQEAWTEGKAYWDPDTLLRSQVVGLKEGEKPA